MSRRTSDITDIVSELMLAQDEAKTEQFFGGDALKVNEYDVQLSNDASVVYSLTLTPDDPELGVLPSSLDLRWTNTNMNSQATTNYFASQVYRADGVFEWRIDGGHSNDYDTYLTLQWIGAGAVKLTRL